MPRPLLILHVQDCQFSPSGKKEAKRSTETEERGEREREKNNPASIHLLTACGWLQLSKGSALIPDFAWYLWLMTDRRTTGPRVFYWARGEFVEGVR